jgi:hypothetical protein
MLSRAAEYLNNSGLGFGGDGLDLVPHSITSGGFADRGIKIQNFDQNNIQPSRKQIGPMLEIFFNASDMQL